jgi:hypothetical protein
VIKIPAERMAVVFKDVIRPPHDPFCIRFHSSRIDEVFRTGTWSVIAYSFLPSTVACGTESALDREIFRLEN